MEKFKEFFDEKVKPFFANKRNVVITATVGVVLLLGLVVVANNQSPEIKFLTSSDLTVHATVTQETLFGEKEKSDDKTLEKLSTSEAKSMYNEKNKTLNFEGYVFKNVRLNEAKTKMYAHYANDDDTEEISLAITHDK